MDLDVDSDGGSGFDTRGNGDRHGIVVRDRADESIRPRRTAPGPRRQVDHRPRDAPERVQRDESTCLRVSGG